MKFLCPHLYLAQSTLNSNSFVLRVIIPLEYEYEYVEEVVPNSNIDTEEIGISIKFGGRSAYEEQNIYIHDFVINPNPDFWPDHAKYVLVEVFETEGEISKGKERQCGTFAIWFSGADVENMMDASPCTYLAKNANPALLSLHTLIPLNSNHLIENVITEEPNLDDGIHITFAIENSGPANTEYPLQKVQYFQVSDNGDKAIQSRILQNGVEVGVARVKEEDADYLFC